MNDGGKVPETEAESRARVYGDDTRPPVTAVAVDIKEAEERVPLSAFLRVEGDLSAREFFQKMLDGMKRTGMRDAHILLPVDHPTLVHVRLLISTGGDPVPPESIEDAMHVIKFVSELVDDKKRRPAPDQYERRAFDR